MPDTSASLLEELRTRPSEQAWQRMVQVYDSLFRGWLTAQGVHPDDSDDLVQEILLVMMRKLPEFEHQGKPGSFRAWARQVALNCVRRSWRTKKRVPVATGDSEFLSYLNQLSDAGSELTQEWDRQHDRVVVQRLLDLIRVDSDSQVWEAFSLHVVKGEPVSTVTETLGVKPGYVYVAKSRILNRLRELADGLVDGKNIDSL